MPYRRQKKFRIFHSLGGIILSVLIKKMQCSSRFVFKMTSIIAIFSLGIAFAKQGCAGLGGTVLVGKWVTLKAGGDLLSDRH
jgi:hypothetical protein